MRILSDRPLVAPALITLALALTAGGCGHADEKPVGDTSSSSTSGSERDQATRPVPAPEVRTDNEQAFLDELTEFGLPTGMSADTTVEVGIGICQNIDDGAGTDTILDHIRPLSSAIATQSADHDTDRVGRAIVAASRAHLCG